MIYEISITEEDIKKGERGKCECCPVALAFQRFFGIRKSVDTIRVHLTHLNLYQNAFADYHFSIPLPLIVIEWIGRFDYEHSVSTLTFSVYITSSIMAFMKQRVEDEDSLSPDESVSHDSNGSA